MRGQLSFGAKVGTALEMYLSMLGCCFTALLSIVTDRDSGSIHSGNKGYTVLCLESIGLEHWLYTTYISIYNSVSGNSTSQSLCVRLALPDRLGERRERKREILRIVDRNPKFATEEESSHTKKATILISRWFAQERRNRALRVVGEIHNSNNNDSKVNKLEGDDIEGQYFNYKWLGTFSNDDENDDYNFWFSLHLLVTQREEGKQAGTGGETEKKRRNERGRKKSSFLSFLGYSICIYTYVGTPLTI